MKSKAQNKLEKQDLEVGISNAMADAYMKALDSLSRYKFVMFGYWAGQWVNRTMEQRAPYMPLGEMKNYGTPISTLNEILGES